MHRGRFQAQGNGVEKSTNWSQQEPLEYNDGKTLLKNLVDILTTKEKEERKNWIIMCSKDIKKAHENGGYMEQIVKSFPRVGPPNCARIDLEVRSGIAFI